MVVQGEKQQQAQKEWLKQYQQGVPAEIDANRWHALPALLDHIIDQFADRTAFRHFGHSLSYQKMDQYCRSLAAYLQQLGISKGDRVAIMMPNCMQYPIALWAILHTGAVVVNVNPLYTADELRHQLSDAGAETIIVMANFAATVDSVWDDTSLKHIIITDLGDMLPLIKRTMVNFAVKYFKKMVPKVRLKYISWQRALNQLPATSLQPVQLSNNDIAFLQYTGGTTGRAKGAMLSHGNILANLEQLKVWIAPLVRSGQEVVVTALPLYHVFSLVANLFLFMRMGGVNLLITNPRDINGLIKRLSKERFTVVIAVNTLFQALLKNHRFAKLDFSHLIAALGGAMAVQKSVAQQWRQVTDSPLIEGYGLTEASPVVCVMPMNQLVFNGSIGLPIPSTDIKIVDQQDNELAIGEVGELWVRGPQVMQGYWQKPEQTKAVLSQDGWLRTGDLAKLDARGFVYLVDRKKDIIIVSGFNVYPTELEEILVSHPQIEQAAVVGVDSPGGEVVKAFIVKSSDSDLQQSEVIAYCRQHLTAYKCPKLIEFCDDLPKTHVGKILRRSLK